MPRNPDMTVEVVDQNPDATVTLVGSQLLTATPADVGKVVTVDGDGDLILATAGTGGPPSGAAGGVLGGLYPDPDFAVDMATQVELQAVFDAKVDNLGGGNEVCQIHGNTGATETIDVAFGNVHTATQDQACVYTFEDPASSTTACSFTLILLGVTGAATWPASVNWPGGTAPTLSGRCLLTFITVDGGTTWDGFLAGSGLA